MGVGLPWREGMSHLRLQQHLFSKDKRLPFHLFPHFHFHRPVLFPVHFHLTMNSIVSVQKNVLLRRDKLSLLHVVYGRLCHAQHLLRFLGIFQGEERLHGL